MKQVYKLFTLTLLVSSLGLAGCGSEDKSAAQTPAAQTIEAPLAQVELGSIPMTAVMPGTVVSDQKAQISSRLMGYIKDLNVKEGQQVSRGELLFSIDSSDIKSQIAQANSAYQQAQAALNDAKLDYDRFSKLFKEDSVSKQQLDKVRLQYSVAQENLSAAKSGLDQARAQLNYANVRAPFDGIVVQKMADAGALASPGQPIVVLENLQSVSVQTEVAGDLYAVLRAGDEAVVRLDGMEQPVVGTIYTLVGAANPKTRTHTVKLSLPQLTHVNTGTFARVSFTRGERQALMVPKTAVIKRAGIEGVFVVRDGKAYFAMVRTGMALNGQIEIQAGLDLGEQIVVGNQQSLLNGDRVTAIDATNQGA
jgi:RND family efflux transporter MFP subunit